MSWNNEEIRRLVGRTIKRIYMNEDYLKFETDLGNVVFSVYGDCCSHSYFHDFIGLEKLLKGNPVVSVRPIGLNESDSKVPVNRNDSDVISCYGFEIVTEDTRFGEVTSVFSFRNSSNGWYGGSLENAPDDTVVLPKVTGDVLEAAHAEETTL
ncbi:hypothetical protein [Rhodococcus aetherivorans]|uniref:DUF7448 domain-containing protein n=1 Tax=Rhodococcus aetherivorans TaxID=191292 RepID=UPI00388D0462